MVSDGDTRPVPVLSACDGEGIALLLLGISVVPFAVFGAGFWAVAGIEVGGGEGSGLLLGITVVFFVVFGVGFWACVGIEVDVEGGEGFGFSMVIFVVPFVVLGAGFWGCIGKEVDGGEGSGLPLICSVVMIVASDSSPASVPDAGTTTTVGLGAKGSGPTADAGAIGGRVVGADADAADVGVGGDAASWPPPLPSLAQEYTVLMMVEAGVSAVVVVYAAVVKVVERVTTMVMMGSEVVLGAASGVHADFGSLEGMASWREVKVFGI